MGTSQSALLSAPDDACAMLNFASSKGISIDKNIIDAIVEAQRGLSNIDKERESVFWTAYSDLAKKVSPVSLAGIQAQLSSSVSINIVKKSYSLNLFSQAQRSVLGYTALTILLLLLFLVVEIYNYIGSYAITSLNETTKEIHEIVEKRDKTNPQSDGLPFKSLGELLYEKNNKKLGIVAFLKSWNYTSEAFINIFYNTREHSEARKLESDDQMQYHITVAEMTIRSINTYVIPIICGILGVCSYILRTMSEEIKNYTFTRESLIRFRLRIPLGCLAGAVAGLILNTCSGPGFLGQFPV